VFQSYALFPHLTVAQNVAFGLEMRRIAKADIPARVTEALRMVRLGGLAERLPRELSGGQQQRVALARALVIRPDVLLLDEPLSNLDAKLRETVRVEIRELSRELGSPTVMVTHDQEEGADHGRPAGRHVRRRRVPGRHAARSVRASCRRSSSRASSGAATCCRGASGRPDASRPDGRASRSHVPMGRSVLR
jgi:ABC-type nitrate/sulfonate/bicarbonate transport system ATPase subunit